jgi:hypothetical protein
MGLGQSSAFTMFPLTPTVCYPTYEANGAQGQVCEPNTRLLFAGLGAGIIALAPDGWKLAGLIPLFLAFVNIQA